MATPLSSSEYINQQRREYSLYVIQQRAIPAATDGLKAGGRRVLWTARDGKKHKSASLAGATMPLHPHAAPEGAIDTLAAPHKNNIPLFKGDGAFGTMLKPTAYGASRYTSVSVSNFTKDVLFRDIEIVPMTENYDSTLTEPVHFLPLVPISLLNPSEGVAIGFATNILPRALDDIIIAQITLLRGGSKLSNLVPKFTPLGAVAVDSVDTNRGVAYYFKGELSIISPSKAVITKLPYGQTHAQVIEGLNDLYEQGILLDVDDNSRDTINIELKFARGFLTDVDVDKLYKDLGLSVRVIENLNVLDFSGKVVWHTTAIDLVKAFTTWRLQWYVARYERLLQLLVNELQRYYDIRTAIKHNVNATARKTESRAQLKELLESIGIVDTDYIADLPIYRFTESERLKNEQRIAEGEAQQQQYKLLLSSEDLRKKVYITELQEILKKYNNNEYTA